MGRKDCKTIKTKVTMVLQDYKIDGEYICISKKELKELRGHYHQLTVQYYKEGDSWRSTFYAGKRDVYIDILKMFEPLMG